jgi:hypothetical protein
MDTQSFTCVICHQPVHLEDAKTDDHGNPVHGECYAAALALNAALKKEAALKESTLENIPHDKPPRL